MGEPIWTNITVHLPAGWVETADRWAPPDDRWRDLADVDKTDTPTTQLVVVLGNIAAALLNGFANLDVHVNGDHGMFQVSGEGNYGVYDDDLEAAMEGLERLGVPHVAHDEPRYEFGGTWRLFDGHQTRTGDCDADGQPILTAKAWHRIQKEAEHAPAGALNAVTEHFAAGVLDLDECTIPTIPPPPAKEIV